MSENKTCVVTIEEQRKEALKHYEEVSSAAHHWSSFVANAIKAYNPPVSEPVREKITIGAFALIESHGDLGGGDYGFYYPKKLPQDKFPAIKQAIESALNDTVVEDNAFVWTDKLVAECHEYIKGDTAGTLTPYGVMQNIKYFKQSKQSSPIPTTPTQPIVEDKEWEWKISDGATIKEVIGEAIGGASLCWNPTPTGVFDSTIAAKIADRVINYIQEQMDKAREDAFNAGSSFVEIRGEERGAFRISPKFPTHQDYINHLKQNK